MRILVVGQGSIGQRHAANARAHAETAIFDLDAKLADESGRRLNVQVFSDYDAALAWQPNGVVVAVPHRHHLPVAVRAVEAGAHVLIEKPISDRMEGIDDFLSRATQLRRNVHVVCNMRFHPALLVLMANLERVGRPYFARAHFGNDLRKMRPDRDYRQLYSANRNQGGGVIFDSIHEIDYLSWMFGPVCSVSCESAKLSDLDIDVEDYAALRMRHASGVRSEVHLDFLQAVKRRGLEVSGDKGVLIWTSEGKIPECACVRLYDSETETWTILYSENDLDTSLPYRALMQAFADSIRTGCASNLLDGPQAQSALAVALAAHRAAREGNIVYLMEPE